MLGFVGSVSAQVPVANFSVSPNPVCAGQSLQVTDLSTGNATAWSYSVQAQGPGQGTTSTVQNPVFTLNGQGTFSITLIASNASGNSAAYVVTVQVLPAPAANLSPASQTTCINGAVNSISVVAGGGPGGGNISSFSFSWSTGSTASVVSLPSQSTTTIISCVITSTNGCSATRNATINVGTPSSTISSNPVNICPGTSSTLTATGSGGGPYTYTWSNAATTRTTTTSTPGVYSVSITNAAGCVATQTINLANSSTLQLNVNANNTVICAGNAINLLASGASTYTWSTGSNSVIANVSPSTTTTYSVYGEVGTCSGTAAITISVNITPTITINASSNTVCAGSSATLNANGAATYTWLPGASVSPSLVVSPTTSGNYTVRGNNPGCPTRNATISISILPSPSVLVVGSATSVCAGDEIALAASGASTYSWSTGATGAIVFVQPLTTTAYTVTGTGSNNCSSKTVFTQTVNVCEGIVENAFTSSGFNLFPVPATSFVTIELAAEATVNIVDLMGATVFSSRNKAGASVLDITSLTNGVYFVEVVNENGTVSTKKINVMK